MLQSSPKGHLQLHQHPENNPGPTVNYIGSAIDKHNTWWDSKTALVSASATFLTPNDQPKIPQLVGIQNMAPLNWWCIAWKFRYRGGNKYAYCGGWFGRPLSSVTRAAIYSEQNTKQPLELAISGQEATVNKWVFPLFPCKSYHFEMRSTFSIKHGEHLQLGNFAIKNRERCCKGHPRETCTMRIVRTQVKFY